MSVTAPGERRVEVVIACHSAKRRVDQAVASVLDGSGDVAHVRVVAHNLPAAEIRDVLRPEDRERVTVDELHDGIPSPTGPFQYGIVAGTSEFFAIMGSDDVLEPGAVASWLAVQRRTGADMVMPRLRLDGSSRPVPTPPVGPVALARCVLGVPGLLSGTRDRTIYRSAPLGLIRRAAWQRMGLAFKPGLPVGEDVDVVTRLALHARTAADLAGPAYVIRDDAADRVTFVVRPLAEQLAFLSEMLHPEDTPAQRRAVAVKCLRIHVFGAIHYRDRAEHWAPAERAELARACRLLVDAAPQLRGSLSRAEAHLLDLSLDPGAPVERLLAASAARRRHGRPATVLPAELRGLLAADGPLRFMAASALAMLVAQRD